MFMLLRKFTVLWKFTQFYESDFNYVRIQFNHLYPTIQL